MPDWEVTVEVTDDGDTVFRDERGRRLRAYAFTDEEAALVRTALTALPPGPDMQDLLERFVDV